MRVGSLPGRMPLSKVTGLMLGRVLAELPFPTLSTLIGVDNCPQRFIRLIISSNVMLNALANCVMFFKTAFLSIGLLKTSKKHKCS